MWMGRGRGMYLRRMGCRYLGESSVRRVLYYIDLFFLQLLSGCISIPLTCLYKSYVVVVDEQG